MVGPQGSGKTALATKIVVDYHNGRKIYANYKINGLPYEHIDPLSIFQSLKITQLILIIVSLSLMKCLCTLMLMTFLKNT